MGDIRPIPRTRRPITPEELDSLCRVPNVNSKRVRAFLGEVNSELTRYSVTAHLHQLNEDHKIIGYSTETFKAIRRGIYITATEKLHLEKSIMAGATTTKGKGAAAVADKPDVESKPVQSPCLCGCGDTPGRGSLFLPGHDAKLKGYLKRGEVSPDSIPDDVKQKLISRVSSWEQYFLGPEDGGVAGAGNKPKPAPKSTTATADADDEEDEDDDDLDDDDDDDDDDDEDDED